MVSFHRLLRHRLVGNAASVAGIMLLFICVEMGLRLVGVPKQGRLFLRNNGEYRFSPQAAARYFSPRARWVPEAHSEPFAEAKPTGMVRVVCLGGSTMAGYPFSYNGTLPSLLRDRLLHLFPEREVEVHNLAVSALGSYAVLDICDAVLRFEPDIVVVYTGHNEFYGALGIGSSQTIHAPRPVILLHLRMQKLSLYRLLWQLWGRIRPTRSSETRGPTLMARMVEARCIAYGDRTYRRAMSGFGANMRALARTCGERGPHLLLCEVVSNLRDQPPFAACRKPAREAAQTFHGVSFDDSMRASLRANAMEIFDRARRAERSHDSPTAARLYRLARDEDGLRFRAAGDVNDSLRTIAREYGAHLVPLVRTFDEASLFPAPGYDLFLDHLHPNLEGYLLVAERIVDTIREAGSITPARSWPWERELDRPGYRELAMVTELEHALAYDKIDRLMSHWPFTSDQPKPVYSFHDSIIAMARRYHDENLSWSSVHLAASDFYLRQRRFGAARREAAAILKQAGGFWPAWMKIGDAYIGESRPLEAAEAYAKAAMMGGPQAESMAKTGSALLAAGRFEAAVERLTASLATKTLTRDDSARARYFLGLALLGTGDVEGAKGVLRELRRDPLNHDLTTKLMRSIETRGDR